MQALRRPLMNFQSKLIQHVALIQLFLDTGRPTASLTQVVKFRFTNIAPPLDTDGVYLRAMCLKGSLNATPMRNLPYRER